MCFFYYQQCHAFIGLCNFSPIRPREISIVMSWLKSWKFWKSRITNWFYMKVNWFRFQVMPNLASLVLPVWDMVGAFRHSRIITCKRMKLSVYLVASSLKGLKLQFWYVARAWNPNHSICTAPLCLTWCLFTAAERQGQAACGSSADVDFWCAAAAGPV